MNLTGWKEQMVQQISKLDQVMGIAQTGDLNAPLIPGKSDVDLFVLCTKVPTKEERESCYASLLTEGITCSMNVANGGIWGYGDIFDVAGIDIMPMYFTISEMTDYVKEVMSGAHIWDEGRFYPTGRLASIESINILYEKEETWIKLIRLVKTKPQELFDKLFEYHAGAVLDEEDIGRVRLRKEILFYHQVLELSLDHMLQALYALNKCYFPSRKRSQGYLEGFQLKPADCYNRMLKVIEYSVKEETLEDSLQELTNLAEELSDLKKKKI